MPRSLCVLLCCLALACTKPTPAAVEEAGADAAVALPAWPDARSVKLSTAHPTPDRAEVLELRHVPNGAPGRAHVKLVLVLPEGEHVLVDQHVPLSQRDALWGSRFLLVAEPLPGVRRAISWDGGASYAAVLPLAPGRLFFCPHKKVEAVHGTPDWPKMLTLERWATGVLETAVWACDEAGQGCKSRSLAGMTVHHGEPEADLLAVAHHGELPAVLSVLETLKVDRFLAAALLDAAVTGQRGLDAEQLEKLGRHAALALGPTSPLTHEERKAMRLRVLMARDEVKKHPKEQLSPRLSVDALRQALADLPEELGKTAK